MGLKCSMFGHDFGDPEVEREREERGDEVVLTVRSVETCTRCGERHVVTENKEVRPIESEDPVPPEAEGGEPEDTGGVESEVADPGDVEPEPEGPTGEEPPAVGQGDEAPPAAQDQPMDTGAEIIEEAEDVPPAEPGEPEAEQPAPDAEPDEPPREAPGEKPPIEGSDEPDDEPPEEPVDDGVILDDEPPEPDRDPGEWPAAEDTLTGHPDEPAEEPLAEPPADAPPGEDEPEPAESDVGLTNEGAAPAPDQGAETSGADEFFCPECGYTVPSYRGSLRVGDICPECHKGYISSRER